ncbi:MAG TPA: DUF1579 family protein [Gemmataceae bacterium]|nr:DUF1579 family protein [Gemmataceae bacterium]
MILPRFRVVVFLLLCAWVVGAAEPPPAQKDPQSAYEPRGKPGAGQKFLEKFVGDWDVVKSFHPQTGDPVRATGDCKQTMINDGRFLRSEFVFRQGDATTTGLGLIGFEPDTGTFTSVWADSRQTRMSFRQSEGKFNGEEIVLHGKSLEGGKEGRRSRTVTRLEDDGRKIVHRQFTEGRDGKERLVMELVLTRKKEAPAGK